MDPALTDMRRGFATLRLGPNDVAGAFSLPESADPAFSTHSMPYVLIGINRDGDTLAAHMRFMAAGGATAYTADDNADPKAFLYFQAADSEGPSPDSVVVFPSSDTTAGTAPVNRGDKADIDFTDDEGEPGVGDNRIGSFQISGGIDSIQLPANIAEKIFNARASDSDTLFFAFSIVDYIGELRRLHNPFVVLHVNKNGTAIRDTMASATRFTAFERDAGTRARFAYSSQHTLRTAVFKINISKIIDLLDTLDPVGARSELVNAILAVMVNRDEDGTVIDTSDAESPATLISRNINSYRIIVSDTLFTAADELPTDTTDSAIRRSLRGRFALAASASPTEPFNTHNIKPQLRNFIEKYDRNGRSFGPEGPYLYVYLRPFVDNSMILWHKPPRVETVFTPSRSQ
jgi:hypothetical protein